MHGNFSLQKNNDDTYDLIISYSRYHDAEFGLDFFAKERVMQSYHSVSDYLARFAKGIKVRSAKIIIGGLVVAVMPIGMMLNAAAASDKYSMGYVYFGSQSQQMQAVEYAHSALDTISPSLFDISADGSLKFNSPAAGMIENYHDMGLRVVPFLSNHWDRQSGVNALKDPELLAEEVALAIEENDLDGVNVDIENLTPAQRDSYVEFVRILRERIPEEKEVSMAVAANPWGYTTGWHGSYDYSGLAENADFLMLMTYDEHYQGGEPGPVASVKFVEDSIQYALSKTDADKIVIGLPFFGRIWSEDGYFNGNGLPLNQVDELVALYKGDVTYDEEAQSPKATFTIEEGDLFLDIYGRMLRPGNYVVWYENDQSILEKLKLVDEYSLKGTCPWALGQQSDQVWEAYQSWIEGYEYIPQEIPDIEEPDIEESESTVTEAHPVTAPAPTPTPAPPPAAGGSVYRPSSPGGGSRGSGGSGGGRRGSGDGGGSSLGGGMLTVKDNAAPSAANTPAATLKRTGFVKTAGTVMRGGAGSNYTEVAKLGAGSQFTYLASSGDWYRVQLSDGKIGFLPKQEVGLYSAGVITGQNVKMLSGIGVDAQVIATPKAGTAVTMLESVTGGWWKIRTADGITGYVSNRQLAYCPFNQQIDIKTTTTALKLRVTASINSQSHGTIPAGEKVQILGVENGYQKVSYGAITAYVTNGYLK
jgi:spore germination protein YaaH/uncharacterized protein YgiM (DUF1202 family)